ncbi:NUDIX hydrolase [Amycolatopsis aidingensis]|uniref:NUDIX hydrolase n=1 Tax=Amycolatopsis aidingensis TaxID=2842453 RepID=UPI001C0DE394|nr:NUDIX domain-containing protein [Amycolatopsis aidingensis]
MTNDAFAKHLGVAIRTVGKWHERPDLTPRTEMQQLLDTVLDQAPDAAKSRFALIVSEGAEAVSSGSDPAQMLKVAIAVVATEKKVLLVCRRGDDGQGISWQFPAGMVKPGVQPETVAVRETLAETGVHCVVVRGLGSRLHPVTNVFCEYLLCDYLAGDAENVDVVENVSVIWADKSKLTRFIPAEQIFPPILDALEVPSD